MPGTVLHMYGRIWLTRKLFYAVLYVWRSKKFRRILFIKVRVVFDTDTLERHPNSLASIVILLAADIGNFMLCEIWGSHGGLTCGLQDWYWRFYDTAVVV
jgi:hypothetical protein